MEEREHGARVCHLYTVCQHISTVAHWIHREFWSNTARHTPETLAALLRQATRDDAIPLSLLALCGDVPVGTVNLIECDDENRSHLTPWLAALFVLPSYRRRGIGSLLVRTLEERAAALRIVCLYLGTDNPSFYARLGAKVHEQVTDRFCIMALDVAVPGWTG
jgi:predicted N-acetyltransferase YhbS